MRQASLTERTNADDADDENSTSRPRHASWHSWAEARPDCRSIYFALANPFSMQSKLFKVHDSFEVSGPDVANL